VTTNRSRMGLGPLLQAACGQDAVDQTDGQLLEQFLRQRDEAAFAVLVRRHGSMVLGVCRRIVGNDTDAEDAFQAAFIILVRKAASLTSRPVLADWLHGVARHTALKAKVAAARRRAKERTLARPEAPLPMGRNDWLPLLDEELNRLPPKYRLPIVLCDLEGKTRQEAAAQLEWPEGTVAGRLARGRELLAKRLLRGVQVLSGVTIGDVAQAALPTPLVRATVAAGSSVAQGEMTAAAGLSSAALMLAEGVMQTMLWNKIKTRALVLLLLVFLVGAGGLTFHALAGDKQPQGAPDKPARNAVVPDQAPAKKGPSERDKALAKAAEDQWEARWDEYTAGKTTADFVLTSAVYLVKAQLRMCAKTSEKEAAYKAHLERMKQVEEIAKAKYDGGSIPKTQYFQVVYHRIEAEIWLEENQDAKK
jgi:RNA polymerase sigma factor (sigma-70 family)